MTVTITLVDVESLTVLTTYEVEGIEQGFKALAYWDTIPDIHAYGRFETLANAA